MRILAALLLLIITAPTALAAGQPVLPAGFTALGQGRVAQVSDGDTVTLGDGRVVRLVGIMAPKLPLGRPGFKAWPWAAEARAGLEGLVLGRMVTLWGGPATTDRHGRVLAHLVRAEDGLWVQGALLERGFARVYSFADNRIGVAAMYEQERAARAAGSGLWSHPDYAIVVAEKAERAVRSFALVEGRVTKVAEVGSRTYLNFGDDWRRDFTIKVERPTAKLFAAESLDLPQFAGRLVRVRGWVKWENGPLIQVTHPEQIEFLDAPVAPGTSEADIR